MFPNPSLSRLRMRDCACHSLKTLQVDIEDKTWCAVMTDWHTVRRHPRAVCDCSCDAEPTGDSRPGNGTVTCHVRFPVASAGMYDEKISMLCRMMPAAAAAAVRRRQNDEKITRRHFIAAASCRTVVAVGRSRIRLVEYDDVVSVISRLAWQFAGLVRCNR